MLVMDWIAVWSSLSIAGTGEGVVVSVGFVVGAAVGAAVGVGVELGVALGAFVAVGVGAGASVGVLTDIAVGAGVSVGTGVSVGIGVGVAEGTAITTAAIGTTNGSTGAAVPVRTWRPTVFASGVSSVVVIAQRPPSSTVPVATTV